MLEMGVAYITPNDPPVKCLLPIPGTVGSIGLSLNSQGRNASTKGHSNGSIKNGS